MQKRKITYHPTTSDNAPVKETPPPKKQGILQCKEVYRGLLLTLFALPSWKHYMAIFQICGRAQQQSSYYHQGYLCDTIYCIIHYNIKKDDSKSPCSSFPTVFENIDLTQGTGIPPSISMRGTTKYNNYLLWQISHKNVGILAVYVWQTKIIMSV